MQFDDTAVRQSTLLVKAFDVLTDEQREALTLVGAGGFSVEEAAEMCGCAPGTIKSRVSRARDRLADLLGLDDRSALEMTDAATMAVVNQSKT